MTILPIVVWPKRIAKKIEAFFSSVPDRGLVLVERQTKLGHHLPRELPRLFRVSAAEDDEVIGVGDDMRLIGSVPSARSPIFQEPIHVDVSQHGAGNTALRSAAGAALSATHAPVLIVVPFLDRRLEPHFDEAQDVAIDDAPGN